MSDTIYAPSTAVGGAIAILRISGPETEKVISILNADLLNNPGMLRRVTVMDGTRRHHRDDLRAR